ncbi:ATP-binding protein [Bifidobacterium oedipodis]|uniref:Crp/Fnr family transcriptional regulator n=1 Tax=Bifidobacterium oedipodis TaxID=2675322 RepID=A0A7Y0HSU5_9BIFI|nr:ATP-binding protein [Bifidobacterium sp. DSM 109957]NMM93963.1 Crp/Fnr family transcriptional regulator [Bifidobacterium sp. DSM 109957]
MGRSDQLSDQSDLSFTYAQRSFASAGLDWSATGIEAGDTENPLSSLLSDQCPFVIKATIFDGDTKTSIRERMTFSGSILSQLDQAAALFNRINESGSFPADALRESLVNALEHRDYTYAGPTLINVFASRLEIISLGGLPGGLQINDLLNGISLPRHPRLASLFADLGLCENCGTGVERIMDAYDGNPVSPQLRVAPASVAILLPILEPDDGEEREVQSSSSSVESSSAAQNPNGRAKLYAFPSAQRITDQATEALANARIIGCAPLQTLVLGRGFDWQFGAPPGTVNAGGDGESVIVAQRNTPTETTLLNRSNEALEQITLNLLAASGVSLSRKSIESKLAISKDRASRLLHKLECDGKIIRHGRSRATTYSLA